MFFDFFKKVFFQNIKNHLIQAYLSDHEPN